MSAALAMYPQTARHDGYFPQGRPRRAETHAQPSLRFSQDAEIFAEGEEAGCLYKVMSGVVRACKFSQDGRRHIDAFYVPGDVFGFELGAEHALSAEAVTECTLVPYRRRGLEEAAVYDEAAARQLYTYAMQALERARTHAQLLGRCNAGQKIAAFLMQISNGAASGVVELAMTRQDMADYLGLTIETVSRTLSQLEKDGVIALLAARRIGVRNMAALRGLCG